jgi:hypothetical protein
MPKPLIAAASHLADVLTRENAALAAMDLRRAVTLLPEKTAAIADLIASGGAVPLAPHPELISAARRLDDLATRNRGLLERAIVAQQRVIGIVVRAASSVSVVPSYGAKGRQAGSNRPMAYSTRA